MALTSYLYFDIITRGVVRKSIDWWYRLLSKKTTIQINRNDTITADEIDNNLETNKTVYLYTSIGHSTSKEQDLKDQSEE